MPAPAKHIDIKTHAYFETHTHEYGPARLAPFVDVIERIGGADLSLVDIGCGRGDALEHLTATKRFSKLFVLDVSESCVADAQQRLKCDGIAASILDDQVVERLAQQFDVAIMAALLHHLIGPTRRRSKAVAVRALNASLKLLKPGGHLLLMEPMFSPDWVMNIVFYLKTIVTFVTTERIPIFGYWNNIGAPVVSYYDLEQLKEMISSVRSCELLEYSVRPESVPKLLRFTCVRDISLGLFVLRKTVNARNDSPAT